MNSMEQSTEITEPLLIESNMGIIRNNIIYSYMKIVSSDSLDPPLERA